MKRLLLLVVVLLLAFYVGWPAYSAWRLDAALKAKDIKTIESKIDFPSVRRGLEPVVAREVGAGVDGYIKDLGPVATVFGPALKQQYLPQISRFALETVLTAENVVRLYSERGTPRDIAERILIEALDKPGSGLGGAATAPAAGGGGGVKLPGGLGGLVGDITKNLGGGTPGLPNGAKMPDVKDVLRALIEQERKSRTAGAPPPATAPSPDGKSGGFGLGNIKRFAFNGPLAMEVGIAKDASATKPDLIAEMSFTGGDWKLTRLLPGS